MSSPPSDALRITHPCPLATPPEGSGPRRDCAACGRTVHDLSALTQKQALRLRQRARQRGERFCGILHIDREGRVRHAPSLWARLQQHLRALPAFAVLFQPGACTPPPPTPPAPSTTAPLAETDAPPQDTLSPEDAELLQAIGYIE